MEFRIKQLNTTDGIFYYPQYKRKYLFKDVWETINIVDNSYYINIPGFSKICKCDKTLIHHRQDSGAYSYTPAYDELTEYYYDNGHLNRKRYNFIPFFKKYGKFKNECVISGPIAFNSIETTKSFMKEFINLVKEIDLKNYNILNNTSEKYSTIINIDFEFNNE